MLASIMLNRFRDASVCVPCAGQAHDITILCVGAVFDHVDSPDRSTSELTVSYCVGDRLGKLYSDRRHHHGYKRGMADASISRVRARQVFLRQSGHREDPSPVLW